VGLAVGVGGGVVVVYGEDDALSCSHCGLARDGRAAPEWAVTHLECVNLRWHIVSEYIVWILFS